MCLILFAIQQHRDYPLVVIANRDEFYARPTRPAHWWDEEPSIYAGRDIQAGGTWMGVDRQGRFAAVTNVREPGMNIAAARSRGELPIGFLKGKMSAEAYLLQLQDYSQEYAGFNLLLADNSGCWFSSNRSEGVNHISPGVYGVSNGYFDEPWPKLETGKLALKNNLQAGVDIENLLAILADRDRAADETLPKTGVSKEFERLLSSRFIHSNEYGTRASSVVLLAEGSASITEQNFDQTGAVGAAATEVIPI
jgi:uncharacterized protein with NRDE domain